MSWYIRGAVPDDAERISIINRDALGYPCAADTVRERLVCILARNADRLVVVCREADGYVGGFLHGADYETIHNGSQKNIMSLAVDSAFRGLGLGRMLLDAIEGWARAAGCTGVRLVSGFDRVDAHQFYLHCGYTLRKNEKNFIKHFETEQR